MFTNVDLVLESTATLRMAATPSLFADYPCLQLEKADMYTCMDFDLDALQAGINVNHRDKFLQQRANCRVAMKRLYQRHPAGTVCVEQVNSEVVVTTLIFILILNRIRSKFANRIKVCNRAAVVRAVMSHKAKSTQATKSHLLSSETGSHNKDVRRSKVIVATTSPAMSCTETMCMFVVKGHMYLPMIIRQRLLVSGDVELNPGPLNALDLRNITNELGSVIDKWFRIGVQLGLSEAKLRQIEADHRTVDRCFSEVISFWLNRNTEVAVSWKSLVEILESPFVDEKGLAKKLREKGGLELHDRNAAPSLTDNQSVVIQGSNQSAQKLETSVGQLISSVSREVDVPQEGSPKHSRDLPQPKPKFSFPSLDLKKLSKEEKEQLHQRLYAESTDITFKFQELFSSTTLSLKECNISPQDLYTHLACLGSLKPTYLRYDEPKQPVLRHYFPQLRKAERIEEAMAIIAEYCSFFNYRIVELIIDKLGTTKDKNNLSSYKKEFSEYAKRHVFECPSELGTMTDGHATLFLTLDETYDDCTVSTLQLFVRKLAEILKLSSDAGLKLHRIEPGSLKLTFQIPIFIQEDIFPLSTEQRRALAGLGVVQLSCGDYQFTNETEEMKLSGVVTSMSDFTSMVAGLSVGKPDDTESVTDSAFGTCSYVSGATSAGVLQSSETTKTLVTGWMNVKPGGFGLIPRSWSRRWFVLKKGKLYYYKSSDDTSARGVMNMSGYSITSAPEIKKRNVFKVLHSKAKTYYFQVDSREEMIEWMRALTEAAQFSSTSSKHAAGLSVVGQFAGKGSSGASTADSAIGTSTRLSVVTGGTFVGGSQFSEDIMERDLRDEPYLIMERDAARLRPPDDSSGLELHQASRRGELNMVKELVENQHHNPLQKDEYGDTALHYAAIGGHLSTIKYFIEEQGLVPACQGQYGRTPLHHAAQFKHLDVVKYLVGEQQVDPLCQDEDGHTSLHIACMGGDTNVIQFFINEIQKYMSLEDVIYVRRKDGSTPLHLATLLGHLLIIKFFLADLNFDPNTPGFIGRPALHDAAQEGHLEIVKYLIEEVKCDPSCPGEDKVTPLHMAAQQGCLDVVRYLTQKHHSNPLSRNSYGNTPLHYAAVNRHFKVVEFFISELNCDPNTLGQYGTSPVHHAAQGGSLDIVKYLIEEVNCSASQLDERQVTPLHMATKKGHLNIVKYLIQDKLCNPLCRSKSQDTPLHKAAREGHLNVVRYYTETLHCSPNIRGWCNMTPLERARSKGHANVVKYLES